MSDAKNILNDNEFFADTIHKPKRSIQQHKKQEFVKGIISKVKLLGGKKQWRHERVDETSNKTINKAYAKYAY